MQFSFKTLQQKYTKNLKKPQQQIQGQQLVFKEEGQINPHLVQQFEKVDKDYTGYHNGHRYYYLHADQQEFDQVSKLKNDQFHNIRKEYQGTLVKESKAVVKAKTKKKGVSKAEKELRFRHYAYLFRKNIKIIVKKLKQSKITVKDIFQQKLFSDEAYQFGKHIFEAIKAGQDTKVWRYYIQNKFVVYSVDSTGKTPLIWACIRGHASIATMLIEMGALLNKKDILNHNCIYYSLHYKHEQCLKILILNQVCLTAQDILKSKQAPKRLKNIVDLGKNIMYIIKRMPYDKRKVMFESQLNHMI